MAVSPIVLYTMQISMGSMQKCHFGKDFVWTASQNAVSELTLSITYVPV